MTHPRRKKTAYSRKARQQMKIRRDALTVEYLRTVRDLAKADLGVSRESYEPLSVYSTIYFPMKFQFEEIQIGSGIAYKYVRRPMPSWKDLTSQAKIEIFQLLCEEWGQCLYAFHPKVHPELQKELEGQDIVSIIRKRAKRRLEKLGELPNRYVFVVEAHDRLGCPTGTHIHGLAMVEDDAQAKAVKSAMGNAAGQDDKGRSKLPSGNRGEFCYFKEGKSFPKYIMKNADKGSKTFGRKPIVFSRAANRMAHDFYDFVTGRGE